MQEPSDYRSRTLVDADQDTKKPEWVLVKTGLFGMRKSFVPMTGLQWQGDTVRAPYTKDQITSAPSVGDEEQVAQEEEARLFEHYGIPYSSAGTVTSEAGPGPTRTAETDYAAERPAAGEGLERREEELSVGKVRRPSELVRLRRWVETEPVSTEVELEREEARVVREPVSQGEAARGRAIGEEGELEVQLEREEPVVEKDVVPRERVRLEKDVTTEERRVEDEVRKERVD